MCRKCSSQTRMSSSSSRNHKQLNPYATPFVSSITQLYPSFRHPLVRFHYCFPTNYLKPQGVTHQKLSQVGNQKKNNQPPKGTAVGRSSRMFRSTYRRNRFVPPRQQLVLKMEETKVWIPRKTGNHKLYHGSPPSSHHHFDLHHHNNKTSVMMRNIPNQFRRDDLLVFLDKYCLEHQLEYDFAYLPMDFGRHNNKGYAFINFTHPKDARIFKELLDGYKWGRFFVRNTFFSSNKICEISWAKIQGKDGLVGHFKNSNFPCYCNEYLPVELSPPSKGSAFLSTLTTVGRYLGSPLLLPEE